MAHPPQVALAIETDFAESFGLDPGDAMSDVNKEWYYSVGGNNQGPLSPNQIRALIAAGTIGSDTLVWSAPMTEWLPLGRTELARSQAAPAAPFAPGPTGAPFTPGPAGGASIQEMSPRTGQSGGMDFPTAVRTCFDKFATFSGRATRPEFWWFYLFTMIVIVVTQIIDGFVGSATGGIPILSMLASLALFVPQLAVTVRRLHDTDRSGWTYFILLIPIVGIILLIVWLCHKGTEGQNRFG